ncbi:MAG: hypothetical protein IT580_19665 [Verrucomicrobiales bacterium]|nr:hypothetical protein [Verrucomicrobiales bacterium]
MLRPLAGGYEHYFGVYRSTYQGQAEPAAFSVAPAALFHAEAGELFQIAVFGLSGLGGNVEFTLTAAAAPPLGVPVLEYGAGNPARWTFPISRSWFLPFAAEMSRDLTTWEPLAVDWVPGMEVFHLPFDGSDGGAFFRLRLR